MAPCSEVGTTKLNIDGRTFRRRKVHADRLVHRRRSCFISTVLAVKIRKTIARAFWADEIFQRRKLRGLDFERKAGSTTQT